jgi:IclR family KDG regulon transcriptional repressor
VQQTPPSLPPKDGSSVLSSVRSAIRLIGLFTDDTHILGVSEIARRLKVAKSTASRLGATLCAEDFLTLTPDGKYRLSVRLVDVGNVAAQSHLLYKAGREALAKIRAATGLAAHLSVIDGAELAQLCRVTSDYIEALGSSRPRQPVLPTSAGKAILAFSSPELVELCLGVQRHHRYAPAHVPDSEEIRSTLQTVRKRGYAVSRNEYVVNVVGVAVPILSNSGIAVAALTALGPPRLLPDARASETAAFLLSSAKAITAAVF